MFDSPHCKKCHEVLDVWEDLANHNMHDPSFNVAYLFCPRAYDHCQRLGVRGYPTLSVLEKRKVYDYQGKLDVRDMTKFVKEKEYLTRSKARHIMHVTSPWENLEHAIHEFRWTMWVIVHGLFKLAGLEYLGEEVIMRLALFMAITPFLIFLMLILNDARELRKQAANKKVKAE